ncbi:mitochondrial cardiolipin hydrolase isoform X2 [Dermacentor silvarum]|uniref:mitochondrial cardiolipin hydrolase isoform X2 n=1 Tax=Dermacentor silvarum TaxID=543639 RepID=UPI002100BCBC|nr:mitochondrial cardiolipin hydrolase isoform X2 [Dermacentor silvarum]
MRVADALAVAFGLSVLSEIVYFIYKKVTCEKKRHRSKKAAAFGSQVIFFPDRGVACPKATHDDSDTCGNPNCCFLHGRTSLRTLVHTLTSAEHTLDVCVYMITCDTLGDAILGTHHRGRTVRVITEAEGSDTPGSQIGRLREAGNHENLLMTSEPDLVDAYAHEFARLWELFKPRPRQDLECTRQTAESW